VRRMLVCRCDPVQFFCPTFWVTFSHLDKVGSWEANVRDIVGVQVQDMALSVRGQTHFLLAAF